MPNQIPNIEPTKAGAAQFPKPAAQRGCGDLTVTRRATPESKCVQQLVAERAALTPGALVAVEGDRSLTYQELDERANRLAQHLRSLGVGPEVVVGLCMKRSFAMMVGALGILKAGGAYLPVDPSYPAARLAFIVGDAKVPVIVTGQRIADEIPNGSYHVVGLDNEGRGENFSTAGSVGPEPTAENLAYVIYTSGSTGQPKGVEIQHGSLSNLVSWHLDAFGVTSADRASQFSGVGFDAAVWELWPYLVAGASVHISDERHASDPEALRDWLIDEKITISFLPTPMAERVMALSWPAKVDLRLLLTGADTLRHYPSAKLPFTLVNNYGPTECTVVTTSGIVTPHHGPAPLPPIGRPIANMLLYFLGDDMKPVPVGAPGELYIGGAGVARGYRNRPDLTAERFIPNPFCANKDELLYRTGDLARILPDGQVLFLGRTDDQIKIRGYRIEPNEIVTVLNDHPAIAGSFVMARQSAPGDRRLVAYLEMSSNAQLTHGALRGFLANRLPEHMIPTIFVRLTALPLNANGKIDRNALPEPNVANTLREDAISTPRTEVEQRLAQLLAPLLGLDQISVDDNFFMLGGHSLLGTQLIARVRDTFGVELSLRSLFDSPTIANLALEIERLLLARLESMTEEEAQGYLSSQREGAAEET